MAVKPRQAVLPAPAVDEFHAVGEFRFALFAFVLAPVELEQLDEVEDLQETCPVHFIVVVAGPKHIAEGEIMGALDDLDLRVWEAVPSWRTT